jgi:hypothetical protein
LDQNKQTDRNLLLVKRSKKTAKDYDRDRPTFYKKIQSVRENDMDADRMVGLFHHRSGNTDDHGSLNHGYIQP